MDSKYFTTKTLLLLLATSIGCSYVLGVFTAKNAALNVLLLFAILFLGRLSAISALICSLFIIICAAYAPTGMVYGAVNQTFMVSLLETNPREAWEYLRSFELRHLLASAALLALAFGFFTTRHHTSSTKLSAVIVAVFVLVNINSWPQRLITHSAANLFRLKREMRNYLQLSQNKQDGWQIISTNKRDLVVVIIGESLRKDYMSAFGYPITTTPWLDSQPGLFFSHYISTAPYTAASLPRTLSLTSAIDMRPEVQNNVVSLANKAGYHTTWLSNQGFLGSNDTAISVLASYADRQFFTKKGGYASENKDDFILLDQLKSVVAQDAAPQVVFVHMMGSHPNPCDRLFNYPNKFAHNFNEPRTGCYLSTISKTDRFIQRVVEIAQTRANYSVIYFSDHGLSVDGTHKPHHCSDIQGCYDAPLIILSRDAKKRLENGRPVSAYHFAAIFSREIGVRTRNLADVDPWTLRDATPRVFDGERPVEYRALTAQKTALPQPL